MRPVLRHNDHQLLVPVLLLFGVQSLAWKCDVNETVCEVWLELEHFVTMMKWKTLLVARDGQLFPYNATNFSSVNAIPKEDVITADGWAEPRVVISVNGTMPGPVIEVYEDQIVRVHVHNRMLSEATSMHFHGQTQRGTPWMDGVSFVTQCPILPGQKFTYQFKADPAGTFWYHSHIGRQFPMGANGAFIVHPRNRQGERYHRQFTMMVQDWNHDWDSTMTFIKMEYGMYVQGKKEPATTNLSGAKYSLFRCQSLLINGRGRYHDPATGKHNGAPLEEFTVRSGYLYRFRVIHSGSVYPFQLWVDRHKLRVVSTDGMELLDPVLADSVILTPGERIDFELNAEHNVGNFWIKAKTLEAEANHVAEAILRYEGSPETEPTSKSRKCMSSFPCIAVNCPFRFFPQEANTACVNVDQLRGHDVGVGAGEVKEYFLNFGFPGTTWTPSTINGVEMEFPPVSALTQPMEVNTRCPQEGYRCAEDQLCRCTSVLDIGDGEVVQLVLTNLGVGKGWDHPVHMHGHSFWVLKVGYPVYDQQTGRFLQDNMDVDCKGNPNRNLSYCNNATWADPSWSGNSVPGLELNNPVCKDTVNVPTGGYVVVRIKADNPGLWSLHCHVSLHAEDGMLMLLNESYPRHPPPPSGFPKCGNFELPRPGKSLVRSNSLSPVEGNGDWRTNKLR